MAKADDEALKARRKAIYEAGAAASKSSWPKFEGRELGSMEAYNWYDGYASTHPGFLHPYRRFPQETVERSDG